MLNPISTDAVGAALLAAFHHNFQLYKSLADRALAQLSAAEWLHQPAPAIRITGEPDLLKGFQRS